MRMGWRWGEEDIADGWMLAEGLWEPHCGDGKHTGSGRARREHFGDLVQLDGSFHAWFEERRPSRLPDEHGG